MAALSVVRTSIWLSAPRSSALMSTWAAPPPTVPRSSTVLAQTSAPALSYQAIPAPVRGVGLVSRSTGSRSFQLAV